MTPRLGSYHPDDITFLLSPLTEQELQRLYHSPQDKEPLIQSGIVHYSQMLSQEQKPDERYLSIFEQALARSGERMGRDIAQIAVDLNELVSGPITLLSLVRAGVPIGVLVHRALISMGRDSTHYGISIIRDRGIDLNAMKHVLENHTPQSIFFVDGWTGKGAITDELESSLAENSSLCVEARLITLADPAGRAWLSASSEDWLIPSGILGSTVSGLISRSVLRDNWQQSDEFHATAQLHDLAGVDVSQQFVDTVHAHVLSALPHTVARSAAHGGMGNLMNTNQAHCAKLLIHEIAQEYSIENLNRIKPGIAEATRAVLRRVPERILVSDVSDNDLAALVHLAGRSRVPIEERGTQIQPYRAITIISHRGKPDKGANPGPANSTGMQ